MANKAIPDSHLKQIKDNFELTERKCGEYTTDQNHVMTKWIIRKLLGRDITTTNPWDDSTSTSRVTVIDDLKVNNPYSGLFHIIVEKIADGAGNATLPKELEKYSHFRENTADLIACGFTGYEIVKTDAGNTIEYVPANEIVIADTPIRYVYIKATYQNEERNFLFIKKYFVGYNTNELWLLDKGSRQNGVKVSFESISLTYQEREDTGLERESIFIGEKEALYEVVEDIIFAFERNLVNIQTQFYKYLEAWLIMRGIKFGEKEKNKDGSIKVEAIKRKIIQTNDPEATVEYVALENPALKELIEFNTKTLIRQISAITSIPTFYFGLEESVGAFGEAATRLRLEDFSARCEKYREVHNSVFDDIMKTLSKEGALTWTDVIRPSNKELLEEYGQAMKLGIITKKQMVMEYWELDEAGATALIAELDAEAAAKDQKEIEKQTALAALKPPTWSTIA